MPPFAVPGRMRAVSLDSQEARMPSGRMIAWIVGLSLATYFGLERYKAAKGG